MNSFKEKGRIEIEQQFLYILSQIIEIFPQYTVCEHLGHILRRKGEGKEFYFWSDETALKKIEAYYDELKTELLNPAENED